MNVTYKKWSLTLDLNGGRIKELTCGGTKFFGTYQRVDGKIGNTHICAPSFDKEGQEKYNLPFHGYARTLTWNVVEKTDDSIKISATTPISHSYPGQLELTQQFTLKDSFTHIVSAKHLSGSEVPFNVGFHYYWDTPKGWTESTLNDQPLMPWISSNGHMNLLEKNTISFAHARYELTVQGLHSAVLWTAFNNERHLYNNEFCCIEPVIGWPGYFGTKESILHPGEGISASIQIKKVV